MPLAHIRGMTALILAALTALPAAPATGTPVVTIQNFKYTPASVTIHVGQSVRFINRDDEAHTATSRTNAFDTGGLDTGDSQTIRFTKPGKYSFFCSLHPYMTGTVIVVPKAGH
jgi:plastocyanin